QILRWALANRWKFMILPMATLLLGLLAWMGVEKSFGFLADGMEKAGWKSFRETVFWKGSTNTFPGMGEEFMPSLNEGSFLLMPTSMPHTGIEKNLELIKTLDRRIQHIPEVELTVGKWGRVNSALDPAPVQMFENTINYIPEYYLDADGRRERFKVNRAGEFLLKGGGTYSVSDGFRPIPRDSLIEDRKGKYF